MTVAIRRKELDAGEPRREAGRCRDARAARRVLASAPVPEGRSREEAARHACTDRQTLRDRAHRHDAEGLAGPRDRWRPGPGPPPTPEREAGLAAVVERGPDPARDGVARRRRVGLEALVEARHDVEPHERSAGEVPRRLGVARLPVRPSHPKAEAAAQAASRRASPSWWRRRCRPRPPASRSGSGSGTRPASAGGGRWPGAGPAAAPGPGRPGIVAAPGPACSAPPGPLAL